MGRETNFLGMVEMTHCACLFVSVSLLRSPSHAGRGFRSYVEPVLASTGPQGASCVGGSSSYVSQYWVVQEGGGRMTWGDFRGGGGVRERIWGGMGPEGPPNYVQMGV